MKASLRCAIYTRKSSEEGLEQDFNSLAAQREACEAYIKSQAGEGWRTLATHYDDGGYSGGNTERPALQELLADIDAGHIDVVVVYKVDRLTRSLADFARIVERFEAKNVSFVSVTQSFNTTSSMGRLTLNVLLSFAQFEREVTGERIRDKIAASKKRGLWMGGYPPLGYLPDGRTLKIEPTEADVVRDIYRRYLELGCVNAVVRELAQRGLRSKRWVTAKGRVMGDCVFGKGQVRHLLQNRLYVGEIPHKGAYWPGLHPPVVDQATFDEVQTRLASNAGVRTKRARIQAPLGGLLTDAAGRPLVSTFTKNTKGARYRYYATTTAPRLRVPAKLIETTVTSSVARVFGHSRWDDIRRRVPTIVYGGDTLEIGWTDTSVHRDALVARLGPEEALRDHDDARTLVIPFRLRRWRGGSSLYDARGAPVRAPAPDRSLVGLIQKAREWREALTQDRVSLSDLVAQEGVTQGYVVRVLRASYLAPDIVRSVIAGATPPGLSVNAITKSDLPLDWAMQRQRFGVFRVT